MKKEIKCPYCGDTWTYKMVIDHENGISVCTNNFQFIEDWETCTCYHCHNTYKPTFAKPDIRMFDFVYKAWKSVKGG